MKKQKNIMIVLISTIIVVLVIGGTYLYNQQKNSNELSKKIETIHKLANEFKVENDRSKKLATLKTTREEFEKFEDSSESNQTIEDEFQNTITAMKEYFTDEYETTLKNNTFTELNTVSKTKLEDGKKNLENLVVTIKDETGIVLDKYEAHDKTSEIEKLISSYVEKLDSSKTSSKSKTTPLPDSEFINDSHYENEYFKVDVPSSWSGRWKVTQRDAKERGKKIIAYYYASIESTTPGFGGVQEILVIHPADIKSIKLPDLELVGYTSNGLGVYLTTGAGAGFVSKDGANVKAK